MFWLLQREEVGDAENVARAAGQAFAAYPHWQLLRRAQFLQLLKYNGSYLQDILLDLLQ